MCPGLLVSDSPNLRVGLGGRAGRRGRRAVSAQTTVPRHGRPPTAGGAAKPAFRDAHVFRDVSRLQG